MSIYYKTAHYKLLLVDDDRSIREYYRALLSEVAPNIEVIEAQNGAEAIRYYNEEQLDCVLLDYELPDMNAMQIISSIQDGPNLSLPIVIFTSHNTIDLDLELIEAGATDFINKKDISTELLANTIFRAIVRFQYSSSQFYYKKNQQLINEKISIEKATAKEKEQLVEANTQLRHLAMHDALTSLPNRAMLSEHLTRIISSARRKNETFYVLFIDLDRFKNINDSLGHARGDILLLEVVCRIRTIMRAEDLMARVGGDEFIFILDGCGDIASALSVCKKINAVVSQKYVIEESDIYISASIGVSIYPRDGKTPEELLDNADSAMYSAKRDGKNTTKFYKNGGVALSTSFSMESHLHTAIENKELSLYYQPKILLSSGEVFGAEALLRWTSQHHGSVSPTVFIPIAEESDLILKLGAWVREEAAKQLHAWKDTRFSKIHLAVNVSGREFQRGELRENLFDLQHRYQIDPKLLGLEITERTIFEQSERQQNQLGLIRALGFGISIDDFGTGYSSLSCLMNLSIDELKIDGSFIKSKSKRNRAIISTIINMAKNLDVRCIAEGVEEKHQLDLLIDLGCDQVQGFYFSKPVAINEFEEWVINHEKNTSIDIALSLL